MSVSGTPSEGHTIRMVVASGVVSIKRGDVLYISNTAVPAEVTPVNNSNRDKIAGVAVEDWPSVAKDAGIPYADEATDIGPTVYDSKGQDVGVQSEGIAWINIYVPTTGTAITINPGDSLVPTKETVAGADGGVQPYVRGDLNAVFADTEVEAELDELARIIAKAISPPHQAKSTTGSGSDQAGLGQNVWPSNQVTVPGTGVTRAFVLAKLLLR